jgi:cysteine-rich repeat protein
MHKRRLLPLIFFLFLLIPTRSILAFEATTTVLVTVCGNAIVEPGEVCDDGINNGSYAGSLTGRNCMPGCYSWAPYCGDNILQVRFSEACDDGNNANNDGCSGDCLAVENIPRGGSGGGTGPYVGGSNYATNPTQVIVQGKAYPYSDVNILKDGSVMGIVKANGQADFYFSTTQVTPGTATFGFWASDSGGLRSIAFTTTLQIVANAATTISGVYLPPTISLSKRSVKKGESLDISGQTIPEATVAVVVNSENEITKKTTSTPAGSWKLPLDSSLLAEDVHMAKAQFETLVLGALVKSTFSQSLSFFVGETKGGKCPATSDLNGDQRVNLVDFSILLYHWNMTDAVADINCDGRVNLADFSIMLFNWTG